MSVPNRQTLDHMRGEVAFRRKLAEQHVTGEERVPGYVGKAEHDRILVRRVEETRRHMAGLQARGIGLGPFLELGAERCQRSLVLVNDFRAPGFAVDLSLDQLRTAGHFARLLGYADLPHRVCCDVHRLPFRRNAFPFVFCYDFLHHFPEPGPVMDAIRSVLGEGCFFMGEEPFWRPRLVLYRARRRASSVPGVLRFLEKFIAEEACAERDHGIVENDRIPLGTWARAMGVFDRRELTACSLGKRLRSRLDDGPGIRNLLNMLLGGAVEGMGFSNGPAVSPPADIRDLLACPECLWCEPGPGREVALREGPDGLRCSGCGTTYPVVDGVSCLLPVALRRELYPALGQ